MKVILPNPRFRRLAGAFCVFALPVIFSSATAPGQTQAEAGGVLVKKPYAGSTNSSAYTAQEYQSLDVVAGNVLSVQLLGDDVPKRMSTAVVADYVDYPPPGLFDQISTDADAARLRNARKQLQAMADKWAQAREYLKPRIAEIDELLGKFDQGLIKMGDEWVDRATMTTFALKSGTTVEAISTEVSGLELAAKTDLGIRRYTFFDLSEEARKEFFPEFAEKVKKANEGDTKMMQEVAMTAYNTNVGDQRFEFARRFFELLGREGDETARYRLGLMKQNGIGIERYLPRAQDNFKLGAQNGFAPAEISYGYALFYGFDGEPDQAAAYEQFKKVAVKGNIDALYLQALMLANGLGVEEADYEAGVKLLQQATEKEHAWAMYDFALALERGTGIDRDAEKAADLVKVAASLGNPLAENAYGYQLMSEDLEGNASLAARLFKSSADAGYAGAMHNMGVLNNFGVGMRLDFDTAEAYYRAAQQAGIEEAEDRLNRLQNDRNRGADSLRGRMSLRMLSRETQPTWNESGGNALNYRLSLFRKSLEQPWLPGGNAPASMEEMTQPSLSPDPEDAASVDSAAEPASDEATDAAD